LTVTIRPPPLEEIVRRWGAIEPMLRRATDRTDGRYEPFDVLRSAWANQLGIWIIEDAGELLGVAVVELRQYPAAPSPPRVRDIEIPFLAGDRLEEWCGAFDAAMAELGRTHGCKSVMTTVGRPGWSRFWASHGIPVRVAGTTVVRDL
jgi:hypothetical protein